MTDSGGTERRPDFTTAALETLRAFRTPVGLVLNVLVGLLAVVPILAAVPVLGLAAVYDRVVHNHTTRIERIVGYFVTLRVPGLLLAAMVVFAPFWLFITTVERARYGQSSVAQKVVGALAGLAVLAACPFWLEEYRYLQVAQAAVLALVVMGLNLLTGYAGMLSIGHGAFVSVGAYTVAMLVTGQVGKGDIHPLVAVLAGSVAAGVLGAVVGLPSRRLKGPYLALVTLALAVATPIILKSSHFEAYTGGATGLVLDRPEPPAWLGEKLDSGQYLYAFVMLPALLFAALFIRALSGRLGRTFKSLRDSEVGAQMVGVSLFRYKLLAFSLSAWLAGFAGGLWVLLLGFISADSFTFLESVNFLAAVVVGGLGTNFGSIMGGVFLAVQPDINSFVASYIPRGDELRWAIYGLVIVLIILFSPRGIAGGIYRKQ